MGRKLSNVAEPTPVVSIKAKVGGVFEGKLQTAAREVKLSRGTGMVYEFILMNTDMPVTLKNASGKYEDIKANVGDLVAVFAPTVLHKALQKANLGEDIRIVYLGKASSEKGGEYHNFDVEAI